jgi:hypothetical protein
MRCGGAASAPPHPGVHGFADAGVTTPAASRNIPAAQGHVPVHRLSEEQGAPSTGRSGDEVAVPAGTGLWCPLLGRVVVHWVLHRRPAR